MHPANDDDDRDFHDPLLRELAAAPPVALQDRDLSRWRGCDVDAARWRDLVVRDYAADVHRGATPAPASGATKHTLPSLVVSLAIALVEGLAPLLTGPGAMLIEAMIAVGAVWLI